MYNLSHVKTERTYTPALVESCQLSSRVFLVRTHHQQYPRSYRHQPYPESVVQFLRKCSCTQSVKVFREKDWRLCCSSCPLDSRICRMCTTHVRKRCVMHNSTFQMWCPVNKMWSSQRGGLSNWLAQVACFTVTFLASVGFAQTRGCVCVVVCCVCGVVCFRM